MRRFVVLLLGFIAAGVFTLPAIGQNQSVSEVLYTYGDGHAEDRIDLLGEAGKCAQIGAQRATYTMRAFVPQAPQQAGKVIDGCYVIQGDLVHMIFEDGDRGSMPLDKFHKPGQQGARGI